MLFGTTFVEYDTSTIAASPGKPGVACIFGRLLRTHANRGDAARKTQIATPLGEAGTIILSPTAVHDYAFCRGVTRTFLGGALARSVPDHFLRTLPAGALRSMNVADQSLSQNAQDTGATAIPANDREAFFDAILATPLPPNIRDSLPSAVAAALPDHVASWLTDIAAVERSVAPAPCGEGEPRLGGGDAQVDTLDATLDDDGLRMRGHATPTAEYLDGDVTFSAELLLTLDTARNRILVTVDKPSVRIDSEVHIAWWAYVVLGLGAIAGAVAGGVGGAAAAVTLTALLATVAGLTGLVMEKTIDKTSAAIGDSIKDVSVDVFGLPGTKATRLETRADGVIVHLFATAMPRRLSAPSVELGAREMRTETDLPPRMTRVDDRCHRGVYSYVVRQFLSRVTLTAVVSDLMPTKYEWRLNDRPLTTPTGRWGTAPDGLDWQITNGGKVLILSNEPGGSLFSVAVSVTASGATALQATATTTLFFEGQEVRWDRQYEEDMRKCIESLRDHIPPAPPLPGAPPIPEPPRPRPPVGDLIGGLLESRDRLDGRTVHDVAMLLRTAGVDPSSLLAPLPSPLDADDPRRRHPG